VSIPHSVAEILRNHVTFELECTGRMCLNVYTTESLFLCAARRFRALFAAMPRRATGAVRAHGLKAVPPGAGQVGRHIPPRAASHAGTRDSGCGLPHCVSALPCESGVAGFFRRRRGHQFASSARMDPISVTLARGRAGTGSREGDRATGIELTYSTTGGVGRVKRALGTAMAGIIQV